MNNPCFSPFPVLETARLLLRQLEHGDAEFIYTLRTSAENNRFLDMVVPKDSKETLMYIQRMNKGIREDKYIYWSITLKESQEMIGTICLWNFVVEKRHAELGYELLHRFQRQGYMRAAFGRVLDYATEYLELRTLEAYTHEKNVPSIRLLEYYDFEKSGSIQAQHSKTGEPFTQEIYTKLLG